MGKRTKENQLGEWKRICRLIDEEDLGIKILRVFNEALLSKWEWKIRFEGRGLWYKALSYRYGEIDGRLSIRENNSS